MSEKIKLKYLKPFGPGIVSGFLPEDILDNFLKLSDDVISNKLKKWNYQLVGRIDDEWKIPELLYKDYNISNFLDSLVHEYANCWLNDTRLIDSYRGFHLRDIDINVKRGDGWINYMTEREYNPVHLHNHCSISTIFYLDDYTGDESIVTKDTSIADNYGNTICEDGYTIFINGSFPVGEVNPGPTRIKELGSSITNLIPRTHFSVKPKKGLFLIFPSWLLHMVNPFKGDGKRVTSSINYGIKYSVKSNSV